MATLNKRLWLFSFPLLCLLWANTGFGADVFYIQARLTNGIPPANTKCGDPPYREVAGSWSDTGSRSSLDPLPGTGARFGWANTCQLMLIPTNCLPGGVYQLDTAHIGINASPDLIVSVTYSNCTGGVTSTDAFQNKYANVWKTIGRFTNTAPEGQFPGITFTYLSGTIASSGGRWYSDCFQFTDCTDPCVDALPQLPTVSGPLAEGQTWVDVPGVDTNRATGVHVFADGVEIGSLDITEPQPIYRVDTTVSLMTGQRITAGQHDGSEILSCRPLVGQLVGGGANPKIRVCITIRQNTTLTGPIGADGGTATAPLKFLGATNAMPGMMAPMGAKLFSPSTCWQTAYFVRGDDPIWCWAQLDGQNTNTLLGNFGVLESIDFAIEDATNTGPFNIYIDNVKNGQTVIQDFEGVAEGQEEVLFRRPVFSGSTSPFLLSAPDISRVTSENADASTLSELISFQFRDVNPASWVRLITQGNTTPNPQVDLNQPITFRMLLLPVGETVGLPDMNLTGPDSQTVPSGTDVTLSVIASGPAPFTYVWYKGSEVLPDQTDPNLLLPQVTPQDTGDYCVQVTGGCGTVTRCATLTILEAPRLEISYDSSMGMITLFIPTLNRIRYVLEYKDDLNAAEWTYATTVIGDGSKQSVNTSMTPGNRFYRVHTE